jgi:hypothetical protein
MRKIDEKFKKYIKGREAWYSPYEGFTMFDIQNAYEAGYKQAAQEISSIWERPKNIFNWLIARRREGLVYIEDLLIKRHE